VAWISDFILAAGSVDFSMLPAAFLRFWAKI
jgi:hypothetical protein